MGLRSCWGARTQVGGARGGSGVDRVLASSLRVVRSDATVIHSLDWRVAERRGRFDHAAVEDPELYLPLFGETLPHHEDLGHVIASNDRAPGNNEYVFFGLNCDSDFDEHSGSEPHLRLVLLG